MGINVPNSGDSNEVQIPPNVQYVIGCDNVELVIRPAGTQPNVTWTPETNTLTFYMAQNSFTEYGTEIITVSENIGAVVTVSTNMSSILAVEADSVDIGLVAASITDVNDIVTNIVEILAVHAKLTDISAVSAELFDITTNADNILDITWIAQVYYGASATDPTLRKDGSALQAGDLYTNTATDELRFYTGTVWDNAAQSYTRTELDGGQLDNRYYTETELDVALGLKAPIASPTFTGIPAAPTPALGDSSTQIATTEFVQESTSRFEQVEQVILGSATSPFLAQYEKDAGDLIAVTDSIDTYPSGEVEAIAFSHDGNFMAVLDKTAPYVRAYKKGVGSEWNLMATTGTVSRGILWDISITADGSHIAYGCQNAPYCEILKLNTAGDTYERVVTSPLNTALSYQCGSVKFSQDGVYLILGTSFPALRVYKRSGDTFTQLAEPTTTISATCIAVDINSDNSLIVGTSTSGDLLWVYSLSADILTFENYPLLPPTLTPYSVAFAPDGKNVAVSWLNATPYFAIYSVSGATLTNLNIAATTGSVYEARWSRSGIYLYLTQSNTPYIIIYKKSNTTFTIQDLPATIPPASPQAIAVYPPA